PTVGEVVAPHLAAIGPIHALEEGGDDLAQLDDHPVRVVTDLGERMTAHAEEERLVALAGAEDAHAGASGGGEQPAQAVEGLGAGGGAPGGIAGVGSPGGLRCPVIAPG